MQLSLWNLCSKKLKLRTSLQSISTLTQQPGHVFVTSLFRPREVCPNDFFLTNTLGHGCSWAILFWARYAPNSEMKALKIVKRTIAWKKQFLLTLWKMPSQLQVSLLAANFESDGMTSHKHGLAATETVLKWRLAYFETNFFRIARTSEAEISVNGKADCSLTCWRRRQKSKNLWSDLLL